MGRYAIDEASTCLRQHRYVFHDRDTKFCARFRETLAAGGVKCLRLPQRSPNLNAFAERWVRSFKVPIQADLVQESFIEESGNPIPRALPLRKKPSAQRP